MSISDMIIGGSGVLALILCMVQIAPIRIDPWTWIVKKIGRAINDEAIREISELKQNVTELKNDLTETKAVTARTRILRFNDEILQNIRHTKEHFDQILTDIDTYEKYCRSHPGFANGIAVSSIRHVRNVYDECMNKNSFL